VLQVNQEVKVKVLDIDRDRQRISLGLKQTLEDPWQKIVAEHRVGDVIDGRVTKIVAFGAFVDIYEGIEGLVHISELANRHVERPDEVVSVGQRMLVKVIEIDSDRRRLSLSIKRVEGQVVEPQRRPESEPEPAAAASAPEAPTAGPEAVEPEAEAPEPETETVEAEGQAVAPAAEPAAETVEAETEAVEPEVVDEPSLGLSDEVFPAGAEAPTEAAAEAGAEPAAEAEAEVESAAEAKTHRKPKAKTGKARAKIDEEAKAKTGKARAKTDEAKAKTDDEPSETAGDGAADKA
jgi:small subunit ribosomal protein S1